MKGYKVFMPLVLLLVVCIYLLKSEVINIVFAPTFESMNAYFLPQLTGDFFKIDGVVYSFVWRYRVGICLCNKLFLLLRSR